MVGIGVVSDGVLRVAIFKAEAPLDEGALVAEAGPLPADLPVTPTAH